MKKVIATMKWLQGIAVIATPHGAAYRASGLIQYTPLLQEWLLQRGFVEEFTAELGELPIVDSDAAQENQENLSIVDSGATENQGKLPIVDPVPASLTVEVDAVKKPAKTKKV